MHAGYHASSDGSDVADADPSGLFFGGGGSGVGSQLWAVPVGHQGAGAASRRCGVAGGVGGGVGGAG